MLKLRQVKSKKSVRTALTLLPHLLLRPKEVVELKWEYFDFNEEMIIIPAEAMKIKKKIHHVPLSNTTFLIFRNLNSMSLDSPYCFPSPTIILFPKSIESVIIGSKFCHCKREVS